MPTLGDLIAEIWDRAHHVFPKYSPSKILRWALGDRTVIAAELAEGWKESMVTPLWAAAGGSIPLWNAAAWGGSGPRIYGTVFYVDPNTGGTLQWPPTWPAATIDVLFAPGSVAARTYTRPGGAVYWFDQHLPVSDSLIFVASGLRLGEPVYESKSFGLQVGQLLGVNFVMSTQGEPPGGPDPFD